MKIATWNVNGLSARLDFLKIWLADRQPDVVGMQEIKTTDDKFPHDEFEALGYTVVTHGQKGWNGVAVASRLPVEALGRGLPGQEDVGARLITARIDNRFDFTTVYCPNGKTLQHDDFPMKLAWFEALAGHWRDAEDGKPRVLCGDFNICRTHLDSWHGERGDGRIFHTKEERERLEAIFDLGLHDLFRSARGDEAAYSWWDYRGGAFHRGQGLRIDLVLGTDTVRDAVTDAYTDRDFRKKKEGLTASDHAPVIAELDL